MMRQSKKKSWQDRRIRGGVGCGWLSKNGREGVPGIFAHVKGIFVGNTPGELASYDDGVIDGGSWMRSLLLLNLNRIRSELHIAVMQARGERGCAFSVLGMYCATKKRGRC